MSDPLRIVFFGSPTFAIPSLRSLVVNAPVASELLVVTQPDRPIGRKQTLAPPPIKEEAIARGLRVLQPERLRGNEELLGELRAFSPDLFVVAAYGKILPKEYLDLPRLLPLNLHGSLLPSYRGAAPVHAAILDGCAETGVTLMRMDVGLDTGDIIDAPYATPRCPITADETAGTLTAKLADLAAQALLQLIRDIHAGALVRFRPQGVPTTELTRPLAKSDGRFHFALDDAARCERRVRAMDPWPGAWTLWNDQPLRICRAATAPDIASALPGTVIPLDGGRCGITTSSGLLVPLEFQAAGKKRLGATEFLRGARDFIGSVLP